MPDRARPTQKTTKTMFFFRDPNFFGVVRSSFLLSTWWRGRQKPVMPNRVAPQGAVSHQPENFHLVLVDAAQFFRARRPRKLTWHREGPVDSRNMSCVPRWTDKSRLFSLQKQRFFLMPPIRSEAPHDLRGEAGPLTPGGHDAASGFQAPIFFFGRWCRW